MPTESRPVSCARVQTVPRRPTRTTFWPTSGCSLSLTSWRTRAALLCPTLNGYKTVRAIFGWNRRSDQLDHTMRTSFAEVLQYAETHDVSNRIAAYMLAIDRVAYTLRQRGIYA